MKYKIWEKGYWKQDNKIQLKINIQGDNMPKRDGKGPRQRSPKPSKPKGGNRLGNC